MEIKSQGTKMNGVYYGMVSAEEKQRVQGDLKHNLNYNKRKSG
jgi:polyisoprenyl-teichoic acid--peptidoglycan teichoic acid transferase